MTDEAFFTYLNTEYGFSQKVVDEVKSGWPEFSLVTRAIMKDFYIRKYVSIYDEWKHIDINIRKEIFEKKIEEVIDGV